MEFNIKNPLHILACILLMITIIVIIIMPMLSFFGILPSTQSADIQQVYESGGLLLEIFSLAFQLVIILGLLVLIPFLWYILVNNCKIKEIFSRLKLTTENIDNAFLWGFLAAILIFVVFFVIELLLISLGTDPNELGNIQALEQFFSPVSLFLLIAIQPVAEEIFFRGFLFDKIESFAGANVAIFITAFLFGIAHMSYQKLYPVMFPMIMGVFLGYIVVKTKNLYAAITAHVIFNITSFMLYFLAKTLV